MQLFFLTVLINLLLGFYLFFVDELKSESSSNKLAQKIKNSLSNIFAADFSINSKTEKKIHLIFGFSACIIGIINLFAVYNSKAVIVGDLIPSLGAMAAGFSLLLNYYVKNNQKNDWETTAFSKTKSASETKTASGSTIDSETDSLDDSSEEKSESKKSKDKNDSSLSPLVEALFLKNRQFIGIYCLVAAILHFLFPNVLFL